MFSSNFPKISRSIQEFGFSTIVANQALPSVVFISKFSIRSFDFEVGFLKFSIQVCLPRFSTQSLPFEFRNLILGGSKVLIFFRFSVFNPGESALDLKSTSQSQCSNCFHFQISVLEELFALIVWSSHVTNGTGCFVNSRHHSTGKCDDRQMWSRCFQWYWCYQWHPDAISDIGTCVYQCVIIDIDSLIL